MDGSYNYGKNVSSQHSELWNDSQQKVFSEKKSQIREILQRSTISRRHLSFTVTVTNNTEEDMHCDLREAYIPISINGRTLNISARVNNNITNLTISPRNTKDILFRVELNTTTALSLVDYMGHSSPEININDINRGKLRIFSGSYRDAVSSSVNKVVTIPVTFTIPQFNALWNIRKVHTSNNAPVTLREALQAVKEDWDFANRSVLKFENEEKITFFSVPLGDFAEADKTMRYIAFLKSGTKIYSKIDKQLLDSPLSPSGCELILVDLDDPASLKKSSLALQRTVFETARELGKKDSVSPALLFRVAKFYDLGIGTNKNHEDAVKWYRKAAEQGHATAQCNLEICYATGDGVAENLKEAVKWYSKAAEQGHAAAQNYLGVCLHEGKGVEKNYEEAVIWYRKAAEQGYATAQNNLGLCYEFGRGVEKNYEEAVKWYTKAAEQGHAKAQFFLGWCYEKGQGVEKNYEEAVKWYTKAAEQGNAYAQFNLGWCYDNGQGVEKNLEEAVKWYTKAAKQGHASAQKRLNRILGNQ